MTILLKLESNVQDNELKIISNIFKPFVNEIILNDYRVLMENIFRKYFEYYSTSMNYMEGFHFFKQFINIGSQTIFYNHHGFFLFFSYQLKDYNYIQPLLNRKIFTTLFNTIDGSRDFSLFCFYKGLIHLSLREYTKAAFTFYQSLQNTVRISLKLMDIFQIYSLERLILLTFIIDKEVNQIIDPLIRKFKILDNPQLSVTQLLEMYFQGCNASEMFNSLKRANIEFVNLTGLFQVAIEEDQFKQMQQILKSYKIIRVSKLRNYLNMEKNRILKILEKKINEGRINIKYDEVNEIIEVIDYNTNTIYNLSELQKLYVEMVGICEELSKYENCQQAWINAKIKLENTH